jgi:hypothetical protein
VGASAGLFSHGNQALYLEATRLTSTRNRVASATEYPNYLVCKGISPNFNEIFTQACCLSFYGTGVFTSKVRHYHDH